MAAMLANLEPVKRMGLPGDIANSVAFLASDEASYINGTSLLVDGGMSRLNTGVALAGGQVTLA